MTNQNVHHFFSICHDIVLTLSRHAIVEFIEKFVTLSCLMIVKNVRIEEFSSLMDMLLPSSVGHRAESKFDALMEFIEDKDHVTFRSWYAADMISN